ncbi:MAG: ECF-type sigma factor [Pirellulaceae bacterium]
MNNATEELLKSQKTSGPSEAEGLFALMYDDFIRLAGSYLRNENDRDKLSATSLVHEAYFRMIDQERVDWSGKTHFFAIGARVMRRILVDHARRVHAQKRGGHWGRVDLDSVSMFSMDRDSDVLALNDMLETLHQLDAVQARIVEMRFFGGMTMKEISGALQMGLRTVEKEWAMARAWMRQTMEEGANE